MLETFIAAVSRNQEFAEIPAEEDIADKTNPSREWPEYGDLEFCDVSSTYRYAYLLAVSLDSILTDTYT